MKIDRDGERASIRRLIESELTVIGASPTRINSSVVRSHRLSRRSPISPTYTSIVELAVLERESTPFQAPNRNMEIIIKAVKNPLAQQAMLLQLGLTGDRPKSRAEIAHEMKISGTDVEALIKSGIEDLRGHK